MYDVQNAIKAVIGCGAPVRLKYIGLSLIVALKIDSK
jgi:hypothetical protein